MVVCGYDQPLSPSPATREPPAGAATGLPCFVNEGARTVDRPP